jgi:hypothetical protein
MFSRPFKLCVKGLEALEAFRENFVVSETLFGQAFENLFNSESLETMKLIVFQIRVVNEFSYSADRPVADTKTFDQRFESAAVAMMAEFDFEHVVGDSLRGLGRRIGKDEFGARIDKLAD